MKQLRILAVDDEQDILDLYQDVLSSEKSKAQSTLSELEAFAGKLFGGQEQETTPESYDLVLCQQGDEALGVVQQALDEGCPFAVAFLDVRMPPGPDGVRTAEQIRALDPHIELVLVTGYSDIHSEEISRRVLPVHKLLYIQKPFHAQEILQFASALSSKWQTEDDLHKAHRDLVKTNDSLRQEIQERKRMQEALQKSEEQHRTVLESTPDPVVVYDTEGDITYLNPAFSQVFGWSLSESHTHAFDFVPLEQLDETRTLFEKIACGETLSGFETSRLSKDGARVEVSLSGAGFFDSQGRLQGSVLTIQDITERKKTEKEIEFIAYHDALTGLPNRKSFYLRLEDELLQAQQRTGAERRRMGGCKWALLFLDLDKFKNINDTLGHDVGDELLKTVALRLQSCLRKTDHIFRLGGDEFTIILNDLTEDFDVTKVAQKIRKTMVQPCKIKGYDLHISISIGISLYPDDGEDVETLVKNADMAMYAAKEETQGYHFFTEEMNRNALERMKLESRLRTALQDHQFVLYYQPLVDNKSQIIGVEALLRWNHPELGLILPGQFLALTEETGTIVPIGKWVLQTACHQAKMWNDMGFPNFYVAVNLSTRQFSEPDLVDMVDQVLTTTGLPPQCLKLEVTESGIMEDPEQAIAKMTLLRAKGIHFSIDDFGTGYSSLSYLKRFPIDTLKIDRSFVMDAPTNYDDQEIIKTILSMADALNLNTVAEGVETREQQDFLTHQGCHQMQGYYFGRPMKAEQLEKFLHKKPIG